MTLLTPALRLVLAALAVFRLSELFAVDYGPFYIFDLWRKLLGVWASGKSKHGLAHSLAELFHCPFCLGIWLGLARPAKVVGGTWFVLGVAYAAIRTRGFRRQPASIELSEL